jgi:hypothetical protein
MKLIYLGEEIDTTIEREFLSTNKNGFKVTIKYNKDSLYIDEIFDYCTEVHNLYESYIKDRKQIAFESDILYTGFTRAIKEIDKVTIELEAD